MEPDQCPDASAIRSGVRITSLGIGRIRSDTWCSLQHQLRQHGDAIASSIVLEQGKTYPGASGASRTAISYIYRKEQMHRAICSEACR